MMKKRAIFILQMVILRSQVMAMAWTLPISCRSRMEHLTSQPGAALQTVRKHMSQICRVAECHKTSRDRTEKVCHRWVKSRMKKVCHRWVKSRMKKVCRRWAKSRMKKVCRRWAKSRTEKICHRIPQPMRAAPAQKESRQVAACT